MISLNNFNILFKGENSVIKISLQWIQWVRWNSWKRFLKMYILKMNIFSFKMSKTTPILISSNTRIRI